MKIEIKDKLEQIKLLFNSNLITEKEYNQLKEEILFGDIEVPIDKNDIVGNVSSKELIDNNIEKGGVNQPTKNAPQIKKTPRKRKEKKTPIGYYIVIGLVFLVGYIVFFGEDYSEIKEKYPEGEKFESIENTSWVLVTNASKRINIYDKNSKELLLKKWYNGDVGGFGITFYEDYDNEVYRGVLINPDEYSKLSEYGDDLVQGKDPESQAETDKAVKEYGEEQRRKNSSSWVVCKNCPGKSCSRCFGRMYYYGTQVEN
jgi:hypothetical protein